MGGEGTAWEREVWKGTGQRLAGGWVRKVRAERVKGREGVDMGGEGGSGREGWGREGVDMGGEGGQEGRGGDGKG